MSPPLRDTDQDLADDIAMALSASPFKVKGQRIDALRILAAGVVRHLKLAGWVLRRRPPGDLHSAGGPIKNDSG